MPPVPPTDLLEEPCHRFGVQTDVVVIAALFSVCIAVTVTVRSAEARPDEAPASRSSTSELAAGASRPTSTRTSLNRPGTGRHRPTYLHTRDVRPDLTRASVSLARQCLTWASRSGAGRWPSDAAGCPERAPQPPCGIAPTRPGRARRPAIATYLPSTLDMRFPGAIPRSFRPSHFASPHVNGFEWRLSCQPAGGH